MQKPALVLVHGYLGSSLQWRKQVDFLSDSFRVITPDLPGFGLNRTLESPETISGYARYVLALVDKADIHTFHLLGHSMGGMIAQEIVSWVPDRVEKLILYGTGACGTMPGRFETIQVSKTRLNTHGVKHCARRISASWFVQGVDSPAYRDTLCMAEQASLHAAVAGLTAMEQWCGRDHLGKITSKTMILWGQEDRSYRWPTTKELYDKIAGATLCQVAACSHAVHLENPQLFNSMVSTFLNAVT